MATTAFESLESPPLALIANDQEWATRSLESVLGPRGFATVRAFTGRQALDVLRTSRPDVVILDDRLPDLPGLELCRLISESPSVPKGLPVILLSSGTPTRAQRLEAHRAGAWDVLTEPHDVEAMVLKLELYVRSRREALRSRGADLIDMATGLYNASGLGRRAREVGSEAARRHAPLSCIAISAIAEGDLPIDPAHDLNDLVLQRLSEVCKQTARQSDVVGRLGRNELVVVIPGASEATATKIAERLRESAERMPLVVGGEQRQLAVATTVSGVLDFADSATDAEALILRAAGQLRAARVARSAETPA